MSVERDRVEQWVREALDIAKGNKVKGLELEVTEISDPRLRDIVLFSTHLGAAVVYGFGQYDNQLWFTIQSINKEVADQILAAEGDAEEAEGFEDVPEAEEMTPQQVAERIDGELAKADTLLDDSPHLTGADKIILSIALRLAGSLVIQLRELSDDQAFQAEVITKASSQLAQLIREGFNR